MKIGIISDIHDNCKNLLKAIDFLNQEKVGLVIFCGDLVSPFTLEFLQSLKAPIKAIFGNNEGDKINILAKIKKYGLNMEIAPKRGVFWKLEIKGLKIAIFHGHNKDLVKTLLGSQKFDLLLTGHTHQSHIKKVGRTTWINPGTLTDYAESKIVNKPSLAIFETKTKKAKIIPL